MLIHSITCTNNNIFWHSFNELRAGQGTNLSFDSLEINSDSNINFGSRLRRNPDPFLPYLKRLVSPYGLKCSICGKDIIPLDIFSKMPSRDALKYLEPYKSQMTETNRHLYYRLLKASEKKPLTTLNDLLTSMKGAAEDYVESKRIRTLDKLKKEKYHLSVSQKNIIDGIYNRFRGIAKKNAPQNKDFDRLFRIATNKFLETVQSFEEKDYYRNIFNEMPTFENNVEAAILRFIGNNNGNNPALMELYKKPFAVLGHVIPYSEGGSVSVWRCCEDNDYLRAGRLSAIMKNREVDNDVKSAIAKNIKSQIDRLIEIYKTTLGIESKDFSDWLYNYIIKLAKDIRVSSDYIIQPHISKLFE